MSDLGKGCLAAMLTRMLNTLGHRAQYRKVEPSEEESIELTPNTTFGGIVRIRGVSVDEDVARVAFYSFP